MAQCNGREIFKRVIQIIAYVVSPLVALGFLCLLTGKNLFLAVPVWSDELDYYREVFSFSQNGFNFGGSLFVGYPAQYGPMGAHSISPLVVWALPALIFPFREHSIFMINLILLCVAWGIFAFVLKPGKSSILFSLLLAVFFPPLVMYLFTSMIEIPLYAGLIVYGALLVQYLRSGNNKLWILLMAVGIWCTLVRMPYIVILFPAIMAKENFRFSKRTIIGLIVYLLSFLIAYKVYNLFCAGYPGWLTAKVAEAAGIKAKMYYIAVNVKDNLIWFFSFSSTLPELVLRYAYGFTIVVLGVMSFACVSERKMSFHYDGFLFSLFIMMGGLWAIMITLYEIRDWKDFRTFSPILLMTTLAVFMKYDKSMEKNGKAIRIWAWILFLLMVAFMRTTILTGDRVTELHSKTTNEFALLETEDMEGRPLTIGATFDVNHGRSGDIGLVMSLPSKLGYKLFYNNKIDYNLLNEVDYLIATDADIDEEFKDRVTYLSTTSYGDLYRIIK